MRSNGRSEPTLAFDDGFSGILGLRISRYPVKRLSLQIGIAMNSITVNLEGFIVSEVRSSGGERYSSPRDFGSSSYSSGGWKPPELDPPRKPRRRWPWVVLGAVIVSAGIVVWLTVLR